MAKNHWQREAIVTIVRPITMAICLVGISACSPYVYNQEITSFSNGINSTVSSYQTGQQTVASLVLQDQQADYVKARARLTLESGCLDSNALPPNLPECAVVPFSGGIPPLTEQTKTDLASQVQVVRAAQTFSALKMYATALTAVTNATDDATLKQASQSLQSAVGTLLASVTKVAPEAKLSSAVASPASNLITLGITAYLDRQRYAVLRDTVPRMDGPVAATGITMRDALLAIRQMQLARMVDDLTAAIEPFETGPASKLSESEYKSQLAALLTKVAAFNQAPASDPSATVSAMIEAHKQLATALLNNAGQTQTVLTAALNFATAAGQLKTAVDAGSSSTATSTTKAPKASDAGAGKKK